jgi:guanosine-3',5'-bis(diphosphate) 3'-pyrophosphohydrolase
MKALGQNFGRAPEELYDAIGGGDLTLARVVNTLLEEKEADDVLVVVPASNETVPGEAITVLGLKNMLTAMAKCCSPTPGDEIIGYITRGHGVTVHRQDCPNMLRIKDRERLVKVSWGEKVRTYPVRIRVHSYDRQGLMGDITTLLNDESVNLVDVQVSYSKSMADLNLVIEVRDIAQLGRILARIEALPNVLVAQRVRGG